MPGGSWKERGTGTFKVNCHKVSGKDPVKEQSDGEKAEDADVESATENAPGIFARFVFRTDGNLRAMLNSPLTKDVKFTDRPGTEGGKSKIFTGYIDGKPTPCLIQVRPPRPHDIIIVGKKR